MKDKAAIEQLKRDLKTYGYYQKRISEMESQLYLITQEIRNCYKVSGISYDSPMNISDPKHSRVSTLIHEESDLLMKRDKIKEDMTSIGIEEKLKNLSDVQFAIITALYFDNQSYRFVANSMNYSVRTIQYHNDKALVKMC